MKAVGLRTSLSTYSVGNCGFLPACGYAPDTRQASMAKRSRMMAKILLAVRRYAFQAHLQHSFTLVKMHFQSMTSDEPSALVHKVIPKICGKLCACAAGKICLFFKRREKFLLNHGLQYRVRYLSTILFT
jgi:hypothetical protein